MTLVYRLMEIAYYDIDSEPNFCYICDSVVLKLFIGGEPKRGVCEKCSKTVPHSYDYYIDIYLTRNESHLYRVEIMDFERAKDVMNMMKSYIRNPSIFNTLEEHLIKHKL